MYETLKNKEKMIIQTNFDQLVKDMPAAQSPGAGTSGRTCPILSLNGASPPPQQRSSEAAMHVECPKGCPMAPRPP